MGPDNPPFLKARTGLFDSISMTMPGPKVLMAQMASAPASSQALAISAMSGAWGVSLTMRGTEITLFTAETTALEESRLMPKIMPCCSELGQEILISIKSGFFEDTYSATRRY